MSNLIEATNLTTRFFLGAETRKAVEDVSFSIAAGETLAIVGESGCGKSMTAYSLMRLVPPPGKIISGKIMFAGIDLLSLSEDEMRAVRGNRLSMVFQEPMTALNPVLPIGSQLTEGLILHRHMNTSEARNVALQLLDEVGIPSPVERLSAYPHELSGGMRQRILIAMALALRPQLLIADEPTTALDVTIQAQILELMDRLKAETRLALLLITHDLGIVAERSDRTAIMYAGRFVEQGGTSAILKDPLHPYTQGLLRSLPESAEPGKPLATIPGYVPRLSETLPGCAFCDRCAEKSWHCSKELPPLTEVLPKHYVRCWKYA